MKLEKQLKVMNPRGLHARPASDITKILKDKKADVFFTYRSERVNARSLMGILVLAAHKNAIITVTVDGVDAQDVMESLEALFASEV